MNEEDIYKIGEKAVEEYLYQRFEEIEQPVDFKTEGYFIYLDDIDLLNTPQQLTFGCLPSIKEGLITRAENITCTNGIAEISILINNEFMFSLILLERHLLDVLQERRESCHR